MGDRSPAGWPSEVWASAAIRIGPSPIEGSGAVAGRDLPAGTVIARLGGTVVSTADRDALIAARGADPSRPYVDNVTVGPDAHLVLPPATPLHHLNHSCDPTVRVDLTTGELVTRRPVPAGEELTTDYALISGPGAPSMRCRCGTSACRGIVP
ncbi:SET domain-containing protein [Iamia sp. SCSIO 61187]|uniref:SET domain-containing protein n=1 Tax=Iamia sp. SCSIO 61187 TaxID=2722752 RepID=UPI001C632100|nr:SET domain-containing protein [Iamia sp. SCSIO 61187]QYG94095.1 SET domain-containing protein [Iamia sp. SCSIO 61187]